MTYIGRTWFILAEFNFSTGRISLPLAEHDLIWLIVTLAGRIWLILAEYNFHWQNMIYTGLLSLLLAEYAANQKCSAVLLCSADSIYPTTTISKRWILIKLENDDFYTVLLLFCKLSNYSLVILCDSDVKADSWYTQKFKRCYYLSAHWLNGDVLLSNSDFFIFAVLVVWFSHSRPYKMF